MRKNKSLIKSFLNEDKKKRPSQEAVADSDALQELDTSQEEFAEYLLDIAVPEGTGNAEADAPVDIVVQEDNAPAVMHVPFVAPVDLSMLEASNDAKKADTEEPKKDAAKALSPASDKAGGDMLEAEAQEGGEILTVEQLTVAGVVASVLPADVAAKIAEQDNIEAAHDTAVLEDAFLATAQEDLFKRSTLEVVTPWLIWAAIACVAGSIGYAIYQGNVNGVPLLMLLGGMLAFVALLLGGAVSNSFSPLMLTGVMFRRAKGKSSAEAIQLAGRDILAPLGLAEDILNVDMDARLVTTREGVVVYANETYMDIARKAGIFGTSGLPPRIDRLFGQAGPESRKIFRLCRAAKSGMAAEEIITQKMAGGNENGLRRFEIVLRPMKDKGEHIAWRLRENEIENVQHTLMASYMDYPRPVFGVERTGQLAWMNRAMSEWVGMPVSASVGLSDFILGETGDLVSSLWEDDAKELQARMRKRSGGGLNVDLTPFLQSGVGEGFVCVEMQPETAQDDVSDGGILSADITEAPFGIAVVEGDIGSDAKVIEANKMFAEIFDLKGNTPAISKSFDQATVRDLSNAIKSRGANAALARPVEVRMGEGATAKIMHVYARPVKRRRGSYGKRRTILYSVDVSFQKRMEEDFAQDQKLKSIGHLAGSIAHDFNNLLMVVMGSCDFLMRRHAAGDPSYADLVLIQQNAQRAKNLTSNLLAFSRKQTLQNEVLSVTEVLREFSVFLNRSITERVELKLVNGRGLPDIKADKGQLELAIMNLAVNARDAMPQGGDLTIETKHVGANDVAGYGYTVLEDVDHVLIEVTDTGQGVPPEIADKIFEPFFTTKGEGKGTGLGLSTVYGIIGQMGGRIFLQNKLGEGATFRIFLPAYMVDEATKAQERAAMEAGQTRIDGGDLTGKGRILIVEDEDGVRSIVVRALQMCGYEIVEATDGDEALEIVEDTEQPFDLVLSDIMMPEMDGPTFVAEAGDKLSGAKVIFMSGYAEAAMRDNLDKIDSAGYLQKPFSLKVVAAKVKEALSA